MRSPTTRPFAADRADLYPFLYQHKILTSRFSYPLPTDEPVMRLVVTALHQKQDLDRLAEVLTTILTGIPVRQTVIYSLLT